MLGRRVHFYEGFPGASGERGDYCQVPDGIDPRGNGVWYGVDPNGWGIAIVPPTHTIDEHEDGTISVHPSIVSKSGYHGHLTRGVWT